MRWNSNLTRTIRKFARCKSKAVRQSRRFNLEIIKLDFCPFNFLTIVSHTTFDLVFKWNLTDPLVTNPDIELPQLDIAKNFTEDCTLEYSTGKLNKEFWFKLTAYSSSTTEWLGNFTCLAVVFNLRRRLGYHLFHTYIPSGLIVVMSWISFWIKPEAIPARVTLGVTSLLTLGEPTLLLM